MIAKKPYRTTPFSVFVKIGAPWANELKERVTNVVAAYQKAIVEEAEFDCNHKMADEDFLYSRFKDNVAGGLVYANWEVLKYFDLIMRIKMYKEFLGEWTFTEHDVEMYNYFIGFDVDKSNRCKPNLLWFKNAPSRVSEYDLLDKWLFEEEQNSFQNLYRGWNFGQSFSLTYYGSTLETHCYIDGSITSDEYWDFRVSSLLYRKKAMLANMVKHCKGCKDVFTNTEADNNFFTTDNQWSAKGGEEYDMKYDFSNIKDKCLKLSHEQRCKSPRCIEYSSDEERARREELLVRIK